MNEKRYRTEQIEGATLPFIVDNHSAKKHKTMTGYKAYGTTTVKKCDELTDLLNNYEKENKELKEEIIEWKSKYFEAMDTVINEYSTNIKEDMKKLEKEVWGDVE